jgi:hypothetical protein
MARVRRSPVGVFAGCVAALLSQTAQGGAREPAFRKGDVPTVFYISKSDDRNRVDYGIHLDEHCVPVGNDAVFPYWREFENSPPVRVHTLGLFEYIAYGISEQRTISKTATGGVYLVRLRQLDKTPVGIITTKGPDGHCASQARSQINGKEAELLYVYVKLRSGGLTPSVEYVDVHGRDLESHLGVAERIRR